MPRNMSFSHTVEQIQKRSKTVTRRLGWDFLKPGDIVCAVEKAMGLKKGEKIKQLTLLEIISVRKEKLNQITQSECIKEGFPDWSPEQFVNFFCAFNKCSPDTLVNRIEFRYLYDVRC